MSRNPALQFSGTIEKDVVVAAPAVSEPFRFQYEPCAEPSGVSISSCLMIVSSATPGSTSLAPLRVGNDDAKCVAETCAACSVAALRRYAMSALMSAALAHSGRVCRLVSSAAARLSAVGKGR